MTANPYTAQWDDPERVDLAGGGCGHGGVDDHHDDPIATDQPRVTVGSRWTDSQAVTWTVLGFQQGRVLVDAGQGLPVTIHRAAFGTTMRPAELPGQLDIFGDER